MLGRACSFISVSHTWLIVYSGISQFEATMKICELRFIDFIVLLLIYENVLEKDYYIVKYMII